MIKLHVTIQLSDAGIASIIADPELPKKEMEFVNQWKAEGILEHFFISVSKRSSSHFSKH